MRETFTVETSERVSVEDVTDAVQQRVPTEIGQGLCTVYVPHTTAGVTVNEAEAGLLEDVESVLASLVPADGGYAHDDVDDNADAHLRSMLLGSSVTIPVTTGELNLGSWQSVLFFEGDGPRRRTVEMSVIASH